jgi:hypothetical protein
MFNGLGMHPGNLSRLSPALTRSISSENPDGRPGGGGRAVTGTGANAARDLGPGWKIAPYSIIEPGETFTLADIDGMGAIQQIWMTIGRHGGRHRPYILRIYWDGQDAPSVETPLGDFFCHGWPGDFFQLSSLMVCHNPGSALCCYWEMPFRKHCRITLTNQAADPVTIYYQINYTLTEVPDDCAYFHAAFRRVNPLPYREVFTIVDGIEGAGQYVGTYLAWGVNNNNWWGEGEIKFYLDDDGDYPTVCGTGTEDYFCGSYNFENHAEHRYQEFSTPYAGMPQVIRPDGLYASQQRFGLYRWHVADPIRFRKKLRVTIQALGWRSNGRYLPLRDDIAGVAFWYQTLPTAPFRALPGPDELEVI